MMSKKRHLKRTVGLDRQEVTKGWRKLYKVQHSQFVGSLLKKYCYGDQTKKDEMGRACRIREEFRNVYKCWS
jgi:hypothetical protein